MAWVEGLTSSNRILLDLAKILTQANKDASGNPIPEKNWEIVYPRPYNLTDVQGEELTKDTNNPKLYRGAKKDWWEHKPPVVYETVGQTTQVVDPNAYTVDYANGTILFDTEPTGTITVDYTYVTDRSLQTAFEKIGPYGRIVLKTTTTPVTVDSSSDPFNTDPDLRVDRLTMYLEIEKPRFLINPETGQVATRYGDTTPIENHYHLNLRIFDRYDYVNEKPVEKVVDETTGLVVDEGAHVSEWAKYAWYQDFKEFLVDQLDDDPGTENINDGIVFAFVDTPGIYGELPIHYWISTNNDRIAMVLMGEPSINFDNYLVSFAYIGKIDSFEGSKNDTAGNFALTVGSSTIPCVAKPNPDPIIEKTLFKVEPIEPVRSSGSNYFFTHKVSYKVVAFNDYGFSQPSDAVEAQYTYRYSYSNDNEPTKYDNFKITFTHIPENAKGVRIYRKDVNVHPSSENDTNWFLEAELTREQALAQPYICQPTQDKNKPVPVSNYNPDELGVVRDPITGTVMEVRFPKTWGEHTATGVNDICMYKTRSGVYYQKHFASFITPDPYMKKDAFNPSRWTGKFHLSPIYVVHGYDGYRGWLKDVVAVDDSSINHLDELVVNKGQPNEEIYKFFKVTAPFSMLQTSANENYGIAIKKV